MQTRLSVLVACQDETAARDLTNALSPFDYDVIQARDAVSATAAMLRRRPDAVILFGELPGGGGVLVLRRIRASVHTAMTPVIAIVCRREGDADDLRLHGADECLSPPPDALAIATWIRNRISRPLEVLRAPAAIIDDPDRLAGLARSNLLDSPPSDSFDALTRTAASLLGVPVALVSLVDSDRQFFKSQIGLPEPWATTRETPLTHSFCQWVVSGQTELVVDDAREHHGLSSNRAIHEIGVVAYAGIPLTGTTGEVLGSLCAIDTKPRTWTGGDVALLRELSRVAEACVAIGESTRGGPSSAMDVVAANIHQSLVMRALGNGISTATDILRRAEPRLSEVERMALLKLIERFARHITDLAET